MNEKKGVESRPQNKWIIFSQYSVLALMTAGLAILLFMIFRGNKPPLSNAVSVLEVLVAILIIMGFELMINLNNVVSDWSTKLNRIKDYFQTEIDNLNIENNKKFSNIEYKIENLSTNVRTLVKLEDIPLIIEFVSRYYDFFHIVAETFGFMIEKYKLKATTLQPYEKTDIDNFRRAWEFSLRATYLFQPLELEQKTKIDREISDAIIYFRNNISRPSCEVLRMRCELSKTIKNNFIYRKAMLESRDTDIHQKSIDKLTKLIEWEEKIYKDLLKTIKEIELKLGIECY